MDFKEILKDMVKRVDGAKAAVLMGYDGIAIDEYKKEGTDIDIQLMGVEYSGIIKEMKRTSEVLEGGDVAEVSVITGNGIVVIRGVSDEYFIMINLDSDGNLGKARYLMKMAVPKLKEQL